MAIIKCKFCHGSGKNGDFFAGFTPCVVCKGAGELSINIPEDRLVQCKFCNGSGKNGDIYAGFTPCVVCRGVGALAIDIPIDRLVKCKFCNGSGKNGDIYAGFTPCVVCKGVGVIERPNINTTVNPSGETARKLVVRPIRFKYDIAISYANEDRNQVGEYALLLTQKGIAVFYDKYEQAELWGKDLYEKLDDVYRKQAKYCVIFISENYANKLWTNHERKSAQARAFKENREYILPVKLDDTELPGIRETISYIDLRKTTINELVELTLEKLGTNVK